MRRFIAIATISFFILACSNNGSGKHKGEHELDSSHATRTSMDTSKKSIPSETIKQIGDAEIKISYHSPAVRGRTI